jgi:hypothetical protein
MHDMSDEDRKQVLGEALMNELQAIREGINSLPTRTEFNELRDDVSELKADVKVIKASVTDQSKQLANHATRIATLEIVA